MINTIRNTEEGGLASELSLPKWKTVSALGRKSCVITLLVGGKAIRKNTGLQEAVFACFLKNIMLHKNWKLISECVAQDKERKTKIIHNFNI